VAAAGEDARPPGQQPGQVGADHMFVVGRIGELQPLAGEVEADLEAAGVVGAPRVVDVDVNLHLQNTTPSARANYGNHMRLGVLDVGSNTVHLLVVDAYHGAHPWPAYSEKAELRLAEKIGADGRLSRVGADSLVEAVTKARVAAAEHETEDLLAFATSAVRDA